MINMMRDQGAQYNLPGICIGTVKSIEPISILVNDLLLDKDDLYINNVLLDDYERKSEIKLSGHIKSKTQSSNEHTHDINNDFEIDGEAEINGKTILKPNDLVALIQIVSDSRFIVLCKVVSV